MLYRNIQLAIRIAAAFRSEKIWNDDVERLKGIGFRSETRHSAQPPNDEKCFLIWNGAQRRMRVKISYLLHRCPATMTAFLRPSGIVQRHYRTYGNVIHN